ncbi:hypothetical protein XELAEV_18014627mg [Xenopus laevis]|uniref:Uncharacterized protein n=1 Tax=Xenopus laevis TaxID=8355 RepID=A0A974DGH9_XENLA|nr:hypothetical protein XELAEV_18014627mg [Xenopus laevis]
MGITPIWEEVEKVLQTLPVNLTHIPPGMALLHLGIRDLPKRERLILHHIFVSTRLLIVDNWKSPYVPKITEILKKVDFNLTAEKSWAVKCGDLQTFLDRASLWLSVYPASKLSEF